MPDRDGMGADSRLGLVGVMRDDGKLHLWDCTADGHLLEAGRYACVSCGEDTSGQMTFDQVAEFERVAGDPEYTAWLAAGKPKLD